MIINLSMTLLNSKLTADIHEDNRAENALRTAIPDGIGTMAKTC